MIFSADNNWDKMPNADIESFMKVINRVSKAISDKDFAEIEEFLWTVGYPIAYGLPGHYDEYVAETTENQYEIEEYIFSHD